MKKLEIINEKLDKLYQVQVFSDNLNSLDHACAGQMTNILKKIDTKIEKNKIHKTFFDYCITFVKDYHDIFEPYEFNKYLEEIYAFTDFKGYTLFVEGYKKLITDKSLLINCFKTFDAYRYLILFLRPIRTVTSDEDILKGFTTKNAEWVWQEVFINKLFKCLQSCDINQQNLIDPYYYIRYLMNNNLQTYMRQNGATYETIFGRRKNTVELEDKIKRFSAYLELINRLTLVRNHNNRLDYRDDLTLEERCYFLEEIEEEGLLSLLCNELQVYNTDEIYEKLRNMKEEIRVGLME